MSEIALSPKVLDSSSCAKPQGLRPLTIWFEALSRTAYVLQSVWDAPQLLKWSETSDRDTARPAGGHEW
jgi:hypothetical protein